MVKKHLHTYRRMTNKNGTFRFLCTDTKCTHYVTGKEVVLGKAARCAKCHREYVIDGEAIRRVKLTCSVCRGVEEPNYDNLEAIEERLREALNDSGIMDTSETEKIYGQRRQTHTRFACKGFS